MRGPARFVYKENVPVGFVWGPLMLTLGWVELLLI